MASMLPKKKADLSGKVIYLARGTFEGRAAWHYLLVDKVRLPILLKEVHKQEVELTHYGKIVFSGFGESPPEEVCRYVEKKYTCA